MTPAERGVTIGIFAGMLDVEFHGGILRWRLRPRDHFRTDREWRLTNTQLAGLKLWAILHGRIGRRPGSG